MKTILIAIFTVLLITGCNQYPSSTDASVITSRSEAWEAAFNAKDIDALLELYTDDSRLLPPNAEMSTGSSGLRAVFGGMIDAGLSGELTSIEAMVSGDIGYNVGTYKLSANGEVVDVGKYMEIWHRGDDGTWRYTNDMFNSDMPVKAPEMTMPKTHMMITHEVDDAEHWLAAWRGEDSRHKLFKENGAAHVHTFRSADNPNLTGLVVAVNDMDAINAMLASEQGVTAAAVDGVRADTITVLTESK